MNDFLDMSVHGFAVPVDFMMQITFLAGKFIHFISVVCMRILTDLFVAVPTWFGSCQHYVTVADFDFPS